MPPLRLLPTPPPAARLRDAALHDDTAWSILESLTTEVGPRPAGSPAAARARDWGVAKLTALGFTNVHVEPFAKTAWLRGAESAEIVAPFPQKLALLGIGNSPPTPPEGITAQVVVFKSLAELKAPAPDNCCAGRIVLVNQPMTRTQDIWGYGLGVAARSAAPEAAKRGAVAYLVRSISPPPTAVRTPAPCGRDRRARRSCRPPALGVPDADLIEHMAARGPVTLHLSLQSHVEDTTAWTVSGDIAGQRSQGRGDRDRRPSGQLGPGHRRDRRCVRHRHHHGGRQAGGAGPPEAHHPGG